MWRTSQLAAPRALASVPHRSATILAFLERRPLAIVLVLIAIASVRIAATYTVFNHTSDEPAHIACGMEWLDKGVYQWEPQHPPLARVAAALGPYLLGIRCQGTPRNVNFAFGKEGAAILYRDHHYDLTLASARSGVLPFFWIACLVVYWWGARYFRAAVGVAAMAVFSFLEPVLAHAGLATTDMALTAFLSAAFLCGLIWLEHPTPRHATQFCIGAYFVTGCPKCRVRNGEAQNMWFFRSNPPFNMTVTEQHFACFVRQPGHLRASEA